MSWDIVLIKTENNTEDIAQITLPIPFCHKEFLNVVKTNYPQTDCSNDCYLVLEGEGYSIEFNIAGGEPIYTIILHVRGEKEPLQVISFLCDHFQCRAFDTYLGDFLSPEKTSGFQEWSEYRDQIIEQHKK